jgi:hypothetical protein
MWRSGGRLGRGSRNRENLEVHQKYETCLGTLEAGVYAFLHKNPCAWERRKEAT